jgi:hypothetical protein
MGDRTHLGVHKHKASKKTISNWQYNITSCISLLKKQISNVAANESIILLNAKKDINVWGPIRTRTLIPYVGNYKKVSVWIYY